MYIEKGSINNLVKYRRKHGCEDSSRSFTAIHRPDLKKLRKEWNRHASGSRNDRVSFANEDWEAESWRMKREEYEYYQILKNDYITRIL